MFNEKSKQQQLAAGAGLPLGAAAAPIPGGSRSRTVSSPIPVQSPGSSRPLSPGECCESRTRRKEQRISYRRSEEQATFFQCTKQIQVLVLFGDTSWTYLWQLSCKQKGESE